jgi:STE24 endopeptidase
MAQPQIDPERQRKARAHAHIQRRLMLFSLAWNGAILLAWLFSGGSAALSRFLLSLTSHPWLVVAGYGAVFGAGLMLVNLPLSFYSEFILQHRFGLSNQSVEDWIRDQAKGLLISAPIGLLMLELVYAVLRAFPGTWWLWAGGILLLFTVVFARIGPVLIAPLFNRYTPLGEEHADLAERLTRLAERAGARVEGVYTFDMSRRTKAANAALTGIGASRRIILGDTLLEEFSPDEIETVLAHELGHHVHKDIPAGILLNSALTLGGLYLAARGLEWGAGWFAGRADIAALPLLTLLIGCYGLITLPLGNAYSRWRERRADQYALQLTGNGQAYASALIRLANQNLAEADPKPWVELLLYSHPAIRRRVATALSAAGDMDKK